jgi:hypothetical protein
MEAQAIGALEEVSMVRNWSFTQDITQMLRNFEASNLALGEFNLETRSCCGIQSERRSTFGTIIFEQTDTIPQSSS